MKLDIDNDFQQKYMTQTFTESSTITTPADVQAWRMVWMGALKSWHSPYKLLVDCTHLNVANPSPEVLDALARMMKFFEGLFLRKAAGFGLNEAKGHKSLPFSVFASESEALSALGVREAKNKGVATDFRSAIQIQNHFQQHVVEVGFSDSVLLDAKDKVEALKTKLTNNLTQWHSKWSLLVDCTNLECAPQIHGDFAKVERLLRGFFMKQLVGYSPKGPKESYPFPVYRARHAAVAQLEGEGNFSGDAAQCKSGAPKQD